MTALSLLIKSALAATLSLTGLAFSSGAVVQLGGVYLGEGSDVRTLSGTAKVGMNNTNVVFSSWENFTFGDGITIGYLKFNQGLPDNNCYGSGDCWAARWNKKPGGNGGEGYLSGWAKLEIGSNSPEMWVHFKAPANPNNYTCGQGAINKDQNYYVCDDSMGKLYGYAWSSGAGSTSVGDNPGLGWIDFSRAGIDFTNTYAPEPTPAPTNANTNTNSSPPDQNTLDHYCYIYLASEAPNQTTCNSSIAANFKAVTAGLNVRTYQWDCSSQNSPTATCNFSGAGVKTPHLNLILADGGNFTCEPKSTVTLASEVKCSLKAVNSKTNDSSNPLVINSTDIVQAKVTGQCIDNLNVNWTVKGLNYTPAGNFTVNARPRSGAVSGSIEANVTSSGKPINCGKVNVVIKGKTGWRN
jgi:hypothetical protein